MARKKGGSASLGDILLYGAIGVGGIAVLSSLFKSSGAQAASVAPSAATPGGADKVATLTSGAAYNIEDALVPGSFTIVEFAADWCGYCQELKPKLHQLVQSRDDVVLRLVDLTDRNSPASAQAVREFNIQSIPYTRVYGPSGQFLGDVSGPDIGQVLAIIGGR